MPPKLNKSTPRPKSSTRPPDVVETPEVATLPLVFPVWNEADLQNERWTEAQAKGKDKGRWPYEAPGGMEILPPSLRPLCTAWLRPSEIASRETTDTAPTTSAATSAEKSAQPAAATAAVAATAASLTSPSAPNNNTASSSTAVNGAAVPSSPAGGASGPVLTMPTIAADESSPNGDNHASSDSPLASQAQAPASTSPPLPSPQPTVPGGGLVPAQNSQQSSSFSQVGTPLPSSQANAAAQNAAANSQPATEWRMVAQERFERVSAMSVKADTDELWMRRKQLKLVEKTEEPWVSMSRQNDHLMTSSLMRHIINAFSILQREPSTQDAHSGRPWQLIEPRGREDMPSINPAGKYAVKLFWLGAWRKVYVDDLIPMDSEGRPLMPQSAMPKELWPLILAKGVCTLASLSYDVRPHAQEFGHADVMQMLTGLQAEQLTVPRDPQSEAIVELLQRLSAALPTSPSDADDFVEHKPDPLEGGDAENGQGLMPEDGKRLPKGAKAAQRVPDRRMAASTRVTPAVGGQQPASAPAAETAPSRNTLVLASYLGSAASEQMGLPADRAHPLRVVGCHSITGALRKTEPLYDDPDDWILQLESPVALYTGPLGYQDQSGAWSKTIQLALKANRSRLEAYHNLQLELAAAGKGHPPFRFYMPLRVFCQHFRLVHMLHKVERREYRALWQSMPEGLSLRTTHGTANPTEECVQDFDDIDMQKRTPWMLFVDNTESTEVLISYAVGPSRLPCPTRFEMVEDTSLGAAAGTAAGDVGQTTADSSPAASKYPSARKQRSHLSVDMSRASSAVTDARGPAASTEVRRQITGTINAQPPTEGSLRLTYYQWHTPTKDNPAYVQLKTNASQCVLLDLPAGRHVFHIDIDVPHVASLLICSDKNITFQTETHVLPLMAQPPLRLQKVANEAMQLLSQLMEHKTDLSDPTLAAAAYRLLTSYNISMVAMECVWEALLKTLEVTLDYKWDAVAPSWKKIVQHFSSWFRTTGRRGVQQPREALAPAQASSNQSGATASNSSGAQSAAIHSAGLIIRETDMDDSMAPAETPDIIETDGPDMGGIANSSRPGSSQRHRTVGPSGRSSTTPKPANLPRAGRGAREGRNVSPGVGKLNSAGNNSAAPATSPRTARKTMTASGNPGARRRATSGQGSVRSADSPIKDLTDGPQLKAAVLTVQRIYRGLRVRLQLLRAREEEVKKLRGDLTNSWASVKNSSADFGVAVIRRLMEIDPEMAHSCCFAADMRFFAVMQESTGDTSFLDAGLWTPVFQQEIKVSQALQARIELQGGRVPGRPTFELVIVDRATGRRLPCLAGHTTVADFEPSPAGYILVAGAYSPVKTETTQTWRLRILSSKPFASMEPRQALPVSRIITAQLYDRGPLSFQYMLGLKPEEEIAHVCVSLPLEPVSATRLVVALQRGSQVLAQSLQTGRCVLPLVDVSGRSRQSVVKDNAITDERNRSSADNNAAGDASNAEPLLLTITLLDRPTLVEDLTEEVAAPEPSGRTTGGASGSGGGGNSSNSGGNNSKNSKRGKSGVVRKKLDANQLKIVVWTKQPAAIDEDLRREREIEQMMLGWEAAQPGRAKKALALREQILKTALPSSEHLTPSSPDLSIPVLNEEMLAERTATKAAEVKAFREAREVMRAQREAEQKQRDKTKHQHLETIALQRKEDTARLETCAVLRRLYRESVVAAQDAVRKAEEEKQAQATSSGLDSAKKSPRKKK